MRQTAALVAVLCAFGVAGGAGQEITGASTGGAAALARAERMLGHTKRVLMIAAHPDDEDTELLTYLVRREGAVTAYLSLTRGEGGQNLIGPELGEALGLIRTEELLAARRLDGAQQFFTRAFDYGFSKSIDEALQFWPADSLLKDAVRIIRRFRPQLVVSVFSGTPRDGHGHHQAAGWVAAEAFRAAGDPARFPELARDEGLAPWQPLKLYRSAWFDTTGVSLVLEGGRLDPEVGQSYRQIAMRSRSLHRSQDMGALQQVGPSSIRLALLADRTGAGSPLFAGVDTAPPRPGSTEAQDLERFAAEAAAGRAGLIVDATTDRASVVGGQSVTVTLSIWNTGSAPASGRVGLVLPEGWDSQASCLAAEHQLAPGQLVQCTAEVGIPAAASPTSPYFLRQPRGPGFYHWDGPVRYWGDPFDPPLVTARFELGWSGQTVRLEREATAQVRDRTLGELRVPLAVVPRLDLRVTPPVKVWPLPSAGPQELVVTLRHGGRDTTVGEIGLDLPPGWTADRPIPFRMTRPDQRETFTFSVTAPRDQGRADVAITAWATDQAGRRYQAGRVQVAYPHIRDRAYLIPSVATVRTASVRLPVRAQRIGYVRGAADQVPEALAAVGLNLEVLDPATLERGDLGRFQTIVVGSRAYEINPALVASNARLLEFVRRGGQLLVQYQQQTYFGGQLAPYPLSVARQHDRVTDETAPVRLLLADDPVFTTPNRIEPADWEGWVQERGLYFPRTWGDAWQPLLEMNDRGGPPLQGGLLRARYGEGTYWYTGLAFFRQLAAGVPGALRLFLNLMESDRAPSHP